MVIHMTNIYLSPLFKGDPCTWWVNNSATDNGIPNETSRSRYIINFLLDSTIGLFIIYIGIRICTCLAKAKNWEAINFGEYSELDFALDTWRAFNTHLISF